MSFEQPTIDPNLQNLSQNTELKDVAKALGYGLATTDASLLTQGGAASYQSLESKLTEIHVRDQDMKVLNKVPQSRAGQLIDEWNEVYSIGYKRGGSISDDLGTAKEGTRSGLRRYLRLKFLTTRWGVNQTLIKTENFMPEMNKEDVAALTRMRQDLTWLIYEGDKRMGDDGTKGVDGGEEFDGIFQMITDEKVAGRYDGPLVFDAFTQGQGLDGDGFSNPADIEYGLQVLAQRMSQPVNGLSQTPDIYVGTSVRQDINTYRNFQPLQMLNGTAQHLTTGAIVQAFANANTEQQYTSIKLDQFLPDERNGWMKTPQTRKEAVDCLHPTLSLAVDTAPDSRFDLGWDGNYYYFIAPFGKNISSKGYEGEAKATQVAAVAKGGKVTVTITRATGGQEAGYLVYRSRRNGSSDPADARLIKRIPATGNVTTFVDVNRELPGASKAYIMPWGDAEVAELRYLYAPFRIEMPRSFEAPHLIPGLVSASYALRSRRHRGMAVVTNLISRSSGWSPR